MLLLSYFLYTDRKDVKMPKKIILTSQHHAKHLFAGQNTLQANQMFLN